MSFTPKRSGIYLALLVLAGLVVPTFSEPLHFSRAVYSNPTTISPTTFLVISVCDGDGVQQ